jgi:hypothetical protein
MFFDPPTLSIRVNFFRTIWNLCIEDRKVLAASLGLTQMAINRLILGDNLEILKSMKISSKIRPLFDAYMPLLLAAGVLLAMAFTLSCSSDYGGSQDGSDRTKSLSSAEKFSIFCHNIVTKEA